MQGRLSLRERLLVVLATALVPLFAAAVWVAVRENRETVALAQEQLKFAAALLAANQDRRVQAAHEMLGAVAAIPELRTAGRARCQAYFEELHRRYDVYANIGLIGADGQVLCHALGAADASLEDREYFRRALASGGFAMGEPVESRLSGQRALPFALPVFENGRVAAVAFATLDLARAAAMLSEIELPPGARVVVSDRHGRVVLEHPPEAARAGVRTTSDPALLQAARTFTGATGEDVDAQGDARLFALALSRPVGTEGFVVRVSIARSLIASGLWSRGRELIAGLALLVMSAMLSVWWIGGRMLVRPAREVLAAVRELEEGNLDARVRLHGTGARGEFARIGAAFNLMAESLELRQANLETELGRSRSAYAVLDQVLNSMPEALVTVGADGRFLLFNEAATRLLPLKDAPLLPSLWPEHFGFFHADQVTPFRAEYLPLVRAALGDQAGQQLVFVRNALVPQGRLLDSRWQPLQDGSVRGGLVVFIDVTELRRLQAEQAANFEQLTETQRKLVEAQRIGRLGNWEIDLQTGRLWWSDELFDLFGITREAFHGTLGDFEERVHPEDRPQLKPARDRVLRDGEVMNLEYRVVKPDGAVAWMNEIAETRRDAAGEPVWFGGVVQDVTERKRHERQLQENRCELEAYTLMLQRAAEAAQAITARPSVEETVREVARQARRVLGSREASMTIEHAAGRAIRVRTGQPAGEDADELAVPVGNQPGAPSGELCVRGPAGGRFTPRDRYVVMELAQIASIAIENARLFTQVRELNTGLESRIAERTAELAREEQRYRALAEQAPEIVWHTNSRGDVTYLNRAWYELVGGEPADWLGQGWLARVHPDDQGEVHANWLRARDSLAPYMGTRRMLARDGTYHTMSYKAAPIIDADGQASSWVGIDADITPFKAIESALRSSNEELEAFSSSVSHDLRAPLAAIGGFSQALETCVGASGDDRALHYLSRIRAGVGKMEQLIDSLLQLSRVVRTPLEWGEADLTAIAHETLEGLQVREPARRVQVAIEPGLVAHGDARLLRLVIQNLLGNAWKFSARSEDAEIHVGRGEDHSFFVRDNGVGFDMAHADRLFTAFQRLHTEAEFPGTGVGLATVRRIIARHQGRVWVESAPGRGTTFHFSLPQAAPPAWLVA